MAIDEQTFGRVADETLRRIAAALEEADDDLEVDLEGGVLSVEMTDGATFLLNKHAPMRQLWLSSPISGATHYDYDAAAGRWLSTRGGDALNDVLSRDLAQAARVTVTFAEVDR